MDSSSFDNEINNPFVFTDIEPIRSNGATSDTYKVLIHGKWHFLKRPKKNYADNPLYLSAFQKEFEIGYTLDHPNIVRYISKSEDQDSLYILTDYVDGFTLTDFIKLNPNYFSDKNNADKLIKQLLSALGYLHERQILHLDLKPDNILITSVNHDVKIVDFGFSYTDCYQSLSIGKTELYAAPEQLNRESLDQRTDIYGFGKVIEYVLRKTSDTKIYSPHKEFINRCLSKNKEDRFKSVSEIQSYLSTKPKSKKGIFILSLISLVILVVSIYIYQSFNKIDERLDATSQANDSISHIQDTLLPSSSQSTTVTYESNDKPLQRDSSNLLSRRIFNNEKYYGKYYDPKELLSDTISQVLFEQYIEKCKQEFTATYTANSNQEYSRNMRLKKMAECAKIRNKYGEQMKWSPQRTAFNQIIAIEQRKISADYCQKSLISELNEYIRKEIPSIQTKENALDSIYKVSAPYWLAFYEKYSIIKTEKGCEDAEKIYQKAYQVYMRTASDIYSQYHSLFSKEEELYSMMFNEKDLIGLGVHANDLLYIFKRYKDVKGYKWIDYVE
ncbi:serine/threonine protein kinase [Dysgonomonas sp. PFB1-18]|uniref:serine/threonine-protein kinase n=1 Tax=unclassified Dysgonomonas TaxID=2630389 RepID=UPI00247367D1|nr:MULTISPECIES: serine/threonine-protein kinase [unclassified Dysgonomonas]MDH6307394.1 serine/threonine protein kinase [Dysgonomonas sp. PF1-14]MDH6337312.1 serine/threonine protein kinase [Dysgonomonas sp. PF1-16]MDH6379236.1 serine/threonine protein kinase [Dysgonomonas sp. PFB1-18]MDH6396126.1 serine/threonine protein kinase [Dysgonomonas sp. PF1-23]